MTGLQEPRPRRSALWFAAHAAALALAFGLWSAPRDAYPGLFHAHANALLRQIEAPRIVLAEPAPDADLRTDTAMTGAPRAGAAVAWTSYFSVVRIAFWPSVALVALILATPLPPLRRVLAALLGLALVDAFALARIGAEIAYASHELSARAGMVSRSPLDLLLRIASESLTATIPSAAFVLVCWVLLARPQRFFALRRAR
jgi:hypothetical protein